MDRAAQPPPAGLSEPALERHLLKRRPGRREAVFVGITLRVDGRREVERGWIVKTLRPERALRVVEQHRALSAALADPSVEAHGLPRVPALVGHDAAAGRIVLDAFPGAALAALPAGTRRRHTLAASVAASGRLEGAEGVRPRWPRRSWSAAHEVAGLDALARDLRRALPGFAPVLFARLDEGERACGLVPAHRDLNEEQIVAPPGDGAPADGRVGWIDWDEAALAPAGLDLGNLLAHERLRALREGSAPESLDRAALLDAYRAAGGRARAAEVAAWEAAACLRLALLARRGVRADGCERNPEWVPLPSPEPAEAEWRAGALEAVARALLAG